MMPRDCMMHPLLLIMSKPRILCWTLLVHTTGGRCCKTPFSMWRLPLMLPCRGPSGLMVTPADNASIPCSQFYSMQCRDTVATPRSRFPQPVCSSLAFRTHVLRRLLLGLKSWRCVDSLGIMPFQKKLPPRRNGITTPYQSNPFCPWCLRSEFLKDFLAKVAEYLRSDWNSWPTTGSKCSWWYYSEWVDACSFWSATRNCIGSFSVYSLFQWDVWSAGKWDVCLTLTSWLLLVRQVAELLSLPPWTGFSWNLRVHAIVGVSCWAPVKPMP